jgi:hypothetical protein
MNGSKTYAAIMGHCDSDDVKYITKSCHETPHHIDSERGMEENFTADRAVNQI